MNNMSIQDVPFEYIDYNVNKIMKFDHEIALKGEPCLAWHVLNIVIKINTAKLLFASRLRMSQIL